MKPVKILILYIKALKFRHDALKFEKEGENIDFENSNLNDIKAFLSKGHELELRSYKIEEGLYNLKQKH